MNYIKLSLFLASFTCALYCSSSSSSAAANAAAATAPHHAGSIILTTYQRAFLKHNQSQFNYFKIMGLSSDVDAAKSEVDLDLTVNTDIPLDQCHRYAGLLAKESLTFLMQLLPFSMQSNTYATL